MVGDRLLQLTWKEQVFNEYQLPSLTKVGTHKLPCAPTCHEGWGLAYDPSKSALYMTDSTDKLFTALSNGPNKAVGFIGSGNYDSVSHLLPSDVTVTIVTNSSNMEALVQQHDESAPARSAHPATRRSREPLLSHVRSPRSTHRAHLYATSASASHPSL